LLFSPDQVPTLIELGNAKQYTLSQQIIQLTRNFAAAHI
jgi:hypothetical protein